MNTNTSKRHQVVSAGNKVYTKKSKSEKSCQNSCSGVNETSKGGTFLIFCQDSAQKYFEDKTLNSLNCSTGIGK